MNTNYTGETVKQAQQFRQGDVFIERVSRKPKSVKVVAAESGLLILAKGEATGHHHSVPATVGTLELGEGGVMYLTIEELTAVTHQEHAPVPLEPGLYRVRRQREYSPEAIRNVAD